MTTLSIEYLHELVNRTGAAFRLRQRLQPAGGPGDKMFPSTFATNERTLKYAVETRRIDGQDVRCVLLDSVASQANRMEEALLAAWREGRLDFPVVGVDFAGHLPDLGTITALQAPHRVADAILRDAMTPEGTPFRDTSLGRGFTDATPRNASALYVLCPSALVFGVWDSTGPKGGLGAKFQRALAAEVVAIGCREGVKVGSRIDPLAITSGATIYAHKGNPNEWTPDLDEALHDAKGKPVLFGKSASGDRKGRPAGINHGNIAPSVDEWSGGITADYALQTVVFSLAALRRLQFRTAPDGSPLNDPVATSAAARTALAALGLAGIVAARMAGFDLRSRCLLVPEAAAPIEIVTGDGAATAVALETAQATALVREAADRAAAAGLAWSREPLKLVPTPKLVALIQKSRDLQAVHGDTEEG